MAEEKKERFELLMEEIRDNVKAVAEGHGVIRSEMKQMEDRLADKILLVDGKVEFLGKEFRELKQDVAGLKKELGEVKEKVEKIDCTLQKVEVRAGMA